VETSPDIWFNGIINKESADEAEAREGGTRRTMAAANNLTMKSKLMTTSDGTSELHVPPSNVIQGEESLKGNNRSGGNIT
jgi:hypothetical protein